MFIPYSSQLEQPASQRSYSAKFGDLQTEDLQLPTLIHIAAFALSTFHLLKLQFYTIIFSLSSKYFLLYFYSILARVYTHSHASWWH